MDAVAHQCNAMLLNNIQGFSTKTRVWNNSMNIFCRSSFFRSVSAFIHFWLGAEIDFVTCASWSWNSHVNFTNLRFHCVHVGEIIEQLPN